MVRVVLSSPDLKTREVFYERLIRTDVVSVVVSVEDVGESTPGSLQDLKDRTGLWGIDQPGCPVIRFEDISVVVPPYGDLDDAKSHSQKESREA